MAISGVGDIRGHGCMDIKGSSIDYSTLDSSHCIGGMISLAGDSASSSYSGSVGGRLGYGETVD